VQLYLSFPTWLRAEIIPGLPFRWYGMMYLVAFAITYWLFMVQIKKRDIRLESDTVLNFFFWGIIGLLLGARLFSTLFFDPTGIYLRKPWLIFWPFYEGRFVGLQGMNYYGGLLGAAVGFVLYARAKKLNILALGDILLAGVPLGYTFGRLGNFINAELYGRVTKAPWGIVFPTAQQFSSSEEWVQEWASETGVAADGALVNLPRHPTQIYEALLEGIILWLIIWFIFRKRKPFDGFIVGLYVIAYGVMRFVIDYFRTPISASDFAVRLVDTGQPVYFVQSPLNLIPSQFYCLGMIVAGIVFLLVAAKRPQRPILLEGESEHPAESDSSTSRRKLRKKVKKSGG
jgi:phosphatidylglycerol:prolipoprotein diacylglycerol transferase